MERYLLIVLAAVSVSVVFTPLVIKLANYFKFLDYPRGHKSHSKPVPLLGGLSVFASFTVAVGLALALGWLDFSRMVLGVWLSGAVLVLIGLYDDKQGLSPLWKLTGQLLAAWVFFAFYEGTLPGISFWMSMALVTFWLVGMTNALNFLDNMDGLCSGVSLIGSLAFAVLAFLEGQTTLLVISLALAGSLLGFARFNIFPARIFLGDAGSMLNGFTLAAMGVIFASEIRTQYALLAPLLILSYPIFDVSFVTLTRLKQGKKFYQPGRDHSSHRLVYMGVTSQKAVWGILAISLFLAVTGILTYYFFASQFKVLIPLTIALGLTLFGIHLHRNLLNFRLKILSIGLDAIAFNAALLLIWQFHQSLGVSQIVYSGAVLNFSTVAILLTFFWINLFAIAGLYEFYLGKMLREELPAIFKTVIGGGLLLFILTGTSPLSLFSSIPFLAAYLGLILLFIAALRTAVLLTERKLSRMGLISHPAAILGTAENARQVWNQSKDGRMSGLQIVGFIDENLSVPVNDLPRPVLGSADSLEEILRRYKISDVIIAVEPNWSGSIAGVLNSGQNLEVNFRIKSDLKEKVRGCKSVPLYENGYYKVYSTPMRVWEWGAKRLLDMAISSAFLVLCSPFLLFLFLKSKLNRTGGSFDSVRILGRQGKILQVSFFKSSEVTRWWHRLPLLLYVLKGDLSLIGPGWVEVSQTESPAVLWSLHRNKLQVRPGLISPAWSAKTPTMSESGEKSPLPGELEYIERMSFTSDWQTLGKYVSRHFSKLLS